MAQNVVKWGTGALQIDAARVARGEPIAAHHGTARTYSGGFGEPYQPGDAGKIVQTAGSWPPNFCLSHCPECEEWGTRRVLVGGQRRFGDLTGPSGLGYGGASGTVDTRKNMADDDGMTGVPAFDCLAGCDCGAAHLHPSGGEPPTCACGRAMFWCCPVAEMDAHTGTLHPAGNTKPVVMGQSMFGVTSGRIVTPDMQFKDTGGGSRFFPRFVYMAKASQGERHAGCDELYWRTDKRSPFGFVRVSREEWDALPDPSAAPNGAATGLGRGLEARGGDVRARGNVHPTVKSLALMQWLVALIAPPGGRVGDVTCGSGGTGLAVDALNVERNLGASFLGADLCPEAIEIAEARLRWWRTSRVVQAGLFGEATVIRTAEPEKPKAGKAVREKEPAQPPPVDARQGSLF